jgi:hypothetical protein
MNLSFGYTILRQVLQLLVQCTGDEHAKDIELLVLLYGAITPFGGVSCSSLGWSGCAVVLVDDAACATMRVVVSPVQRGRTRREVLGSDG